MLQNGAKSVESKMHYSYEYSKFCSQRQDEMNLKKLSTSPLIYKAAGSPRKVSLFPINKMMWLSSFELHD